MPYTVPPLPYDYAALEPHIDEQTMRIHHDKHHQAYVDRVNGALEGTQWADTPIEDVIRDLQQIPEDKRAVVRNHGGGHLNHTLFWKFMSPQGGGSPSGDLAAAIDAKFGSFDEFKAAFKAARRQPVRLGLGLAGQGRRRARRRLDRQSGQPGHGRQGAAPRRRRLGARVLPQVPEPPPGLPRRVLERRRLGRRRAALRGLMRADLS